MFEEYDLNNLYYADVECYIPVVIENYNGDMKINGIKKKRYRTIVYRSQFNVTDIFHPDRFVNLIVNGEKRSYPVLSKGHYAYEAVEDDMELFLNDDLRKKGYKSLTRIPFKKYILSK